MVMWLYQGDFYFILYVYFIPDVLQWMCIAFLIRKNNHNLKYRTLMLAGMLCSMVCPEALYSPRNSPADQNNMLGRRIFLVLLRMF